MTILLILALVHHLSLQLGSLRDMTKNELEKIWLLFLDSYLRPA